jgi:phage terminase large subunit GpA-like protein
VTPHLQGIDPGYAGAAGALQRGIRPDPEFWLDEWSERYMVLPPDSPRPGKYRLEHTPMARRILRCLSPGHAARRVVIRGASQMLKTQVGMNFLAGMAHQRPANMLVLEPTTPLAKRLSARVSKTIRDVPELAAIFAKARSRDSRNSTFSKDFEGGTMHIATFGSAANLRELSAPYVYVDEVDGGERDVDGEGDAGMLAEARGTAFEDRAKFLHTSSPTQAGASRIDELYERGTQEVYLVPCPHCGHCHELLVDNFRYQRDETDGIMARAWFICPSCGAEIDERDKFSMLRDEALGGTAHWHARAPGDGETVSFHVSAFYAGVGSISWLKLARELDRARAMKERGAPEAEQVFWNTRLALSYSNTENTSSTRDLSTRPRVPPRQVPDWALVLTTSVDTQPNRLEVQTHAWGPGLEHAVIDYTVLMGSPTEHPESPTSVWARLDAYRATPWPHASGVVIMASEYGIDTGGHNTQDVYNYASGRRHVGCLALHGSSRPERPIIGSTPTKVDIDWQGKRVQGGVELWTIGTDTAKDWLHSRFKLEAGWGAMHYNEALDQAWFEGLLAERPTLKRRPGGGYRRVWEKAAQGDRNEPLDLTVYNLAIAHHLGLHKWTMADWARLRERLIPKQYTPDLFAVAETAAAVQQQDQPAAAPPAEPAASPAAPPAAAPPPQHDEEPPRDAAPTAPAPPPIVVAPTPIVVAPAPPPAPPPIPHLPTPAPAGRRILSRGLA